MCSIETGVRVCTSSLPLMLERILGGIYILDLEPFEGNNDVLLKNGIGYVVSVVSGLPPAVQLPQHHIDLTDEETTNIIEHFPPALDFIDSALFPSLASDNKHLSAILIHCAQGRSRSVTIVVAYLMHKYKLLVLQAMRAVTRRVPDAGPNCGFMRQLEMFYQMGCTFDALSSVYRAYLVELSLQLDPSGKALAELDINKKTQSIKEKDSAYSLRCKRCRQTLAAEGNVVEHEIPDAESKQSLFVKLASYSRHVVSSEAGANHCSHYFMDEPLDWMSTELEKQDIEGKFACPKCDAKVGAYSWRGSRCSCGKWMVPAVHLNLARVDKMKRV